MANTLGNYNAPLYATAALDILMQAMGTARRVNRDYEGERRAFNRGEYVNISRPSTFETQAAPVTAANASDAATESIAIQLATHREVKFGFTDRELTYSSDAIVRQHIAPAAYAIARYIETDLLSKSFLFPHCQQITASSATQAVLTGADKILAENGVPDMDRHYAASPRVWNAWQNLAAFSNQQGAGDVGISTQVTGQIGPKFGFSPYRSAHLLQVAAQTSPTITTGVTNGAAVKGATTIAVDAGTLTGTFRAGMVIQIGTAGSTTGKAYNDQLYSITADVTASGNAATLSISPPLRADVADGVTFTQKVNASAALFETELAFHRDAMALVMAPLPMQVPGNSAEVQTVTDENSGISVRLRMFYDAHAMKHYCSMDALYGVQVLNPDMGVRGIVV
jgi:hypothetical protein